MVECAEGEVSALAMNRRACTGSVVMADILGIISVVLVGESSSTICSA